MMIMEFGTGASLAIRELLKSVAVNIRSIFRGSTFFMQALLIKTMLVWGGNVSLVGE
jgi:hypothetical protein